MPASQLAVSPDPDAYDAVFTAILEYHPNDIVSTRIVLKEVRRLTPSCELCDEELVALIVKQATGSTMIVSFDHHEAT